MLETIIGAVVTIFPLIPVNNWLMTLVKVAAAESATKAWLRGALIVMSFLGVLASSSLTGNDIDFNQISDLFMLFVEVTGLSLASHFSYKAISIKSKAV